MNKISKTLNRYNGNLCFAAESDSGFIIFECDRLTGGYNIAKVMKKEFKNVK